MLQGREAAHTVLTSAAMMRSSAVEVWSLAASSRLQIIWRTTVPMPLSREESPITTSRGICVKIMASNGRWLVAHSSTVPSSPPPRVWAPVICVMSLIQRLTWSLPPSSSAAAPLPLGEVVGPIALMEAPTSHNSPIDGPASTDHLWVQGGWVS